MVTAVCCIGKDVFKQYTKHLMYKALKNIVSVQRVRTVFWNHLSAQTCWLPWNNAGEQHYTHKCCHMQSQKPSGRRQNRNFKARAHMFQIPSHLSYCKGSCKKKCKFWMQVLEKPESVMMPRLRVCSLCKDKMDKSTIPEQEKKREWY